MDKSNSNRQEKHQDISNKVLFYFYYFFYLIDYSLNLKIKSLEKFFLNVKETYEQNFGQNKSLLTQVSEIFLLIFLYLDGNIYQ